MSILTGDNPFADYKQKQINEINLDKIKKAVIDVFDTNGDGKLDFDDLPSLPDIDMEKLAKVVTASAVAAGVTAAGAAAAGAAIVSSTAASIGAGAASAAGVIAGYGLGSGAASVYGAVKAYQVSKAAAFVTGKWAAAVGITDVFTLQAVNAVVVEKMAAAVAPQVLATMSALKTATTSAGASVGFVAEIAAGEIAGLPIVKSAATSIAVARGEVFVIGGIAFSVQAAIILGLIAVVVIGGYTYWVYTGKDKKCKLKKGKPQVDLK